MKYSATFLFFLTTIFIACQTKTPTNSTNQSQAAPYLDLNVKEFKEKMTAANTVVLDVRTPTEIAEGKIEGAIEIDFKEDGFAEKIDGLDKEKNYLIYCKSGGRSSNTCKMMAKKGFKKLYNLDGGFTAWTANN